MSQNNESQVQFEQRIETSLMDTEDIPASYTEYVPKVTPKKKDAFMKDEEGNKTYTDTNSSTSNNVEVIPAAAVSAFDPNN